MKLDYKNTVYHGEVLDPVMKTELHETEHVLSNDGKR